MESMILQGASSSGLFIGKPALAMYVQGITFSLPVSGTLTNASVSLSGAVNNQTYTFNNSVNMVLQFAPNEDVYVTTTNFGSGYSAVINYLTVGDSTSITQTDRTARPHIFSVETPWRFR
jgi:hypothetical protein